MPRGIPNVKQPLSTIPAEELNAHAFAAMPQAPAPEDVQILASIKAKNHEEVAAARAKMITVKLERNCRPGGEFEIVGHMQPELRRKSPAGVMELVRPEEFIKGEPAPPPMPGVGTKGKLWAGTVISLPEAEAKALKRAGIASYELVD